MLVKRFRVVEIDVALVPETFLDVLRGRGGVHGRMRQMVIVELSVGWEAGTAGWNGEDARKSIE